MTTCRDLYERRLQPGDRVTVCLEGFPDHANPLRADAWRRLPPAIHTVREVYPETGYVCHQWFVSLEGEDATMWDGRLFKPWPPIGFRGKVAP